MKITKIGHFGLQLIKDFEGFSSTPYLCPAGVPTIGYGSTHYEDGSKVRLSDNLITRNRAEELLINTLATYERAVDAYCIDNINQQQFDALTSFAYNLGTNALKVSTLLKKVNLNPEDKTIPKEFLKWVYCDGKKLQGLINRRTAEANLYKLK